MNVFTCRLPERTKRGLFETAKRYGLSMSELVRATLWMVTNDEIALSLVVREAKHDEEQK